MIDKKREDKEENIVFCVLIWGEIKKKNKQKFSENLISSLNTENQSIINVCVCMYVYVCAPVADHSDRDRDRDRDRERGEKEG